jgi:hypothetical protein
LTKSVLKVYNFPVGHGDLLPKIEWLALANFSESFSLPLYQKND